ncbi:hypothetical protein [Arthrobacter sp. L77]|uniref:hypothetical protein n=1 Tax=Arthrobacter sp. L77 TaxID=1496689 RepID=UPI000B297A57|nr:hypothetical protein [Arthrobacter sp. L77]
MYVLFVVELRGWTEAETDVLVSAYFGMLEQETQDEAYSKTAYNRYVQSLTGRSKGSIEFKFCNISHVLWEAGLKYVKGYKPRSHVQSTLRVAVLELVRHDARDTVRPDSDTDYSREVPEQSETVQEVNRTDIVNKGDFLPDPNNSSTGSDPLWEGLANLWDRATGGTDVAARPDHPIDSVWPSTLRPAGVAEACNWLRDGLSTGAQTRFLFLVGGPGAGKSHATAQVVQGLRPVNAPESGLAHRVYEYTGVNADLVVVNDATINLEPSEKAPLVSDINTIAMSSKTQITKHPRHLMACVNRGILVEETSESRTLNFSDLGSGDVIVRWLYDPSSINELDLAWRLTSMSGHDFIRSARLVHSGRHVADIVAVFVDESSLFEEQPAVEIGVDSRAMAETYRIRPLMERIGLDESRAPAADLLVKILEVADRRADSPKKLNTDGIADPLAANIESLRSQAVRSGLLTLARSAELASATRMTYRELWGFLTRALVGDAPSHMPREKLGRYILSNQPTGKGTTEDFEALKKLAALRFSQGIFGVSVQSNASVGALRDPVLKLLLPIDPVRDAVPGSEPTAVDRGWATPISEAFGIHSSEGTPLGSLLASEPEESPFVDATTDFDRRVDKAFIDLIQSSGLKDSDRLDATVWYGAYLTRLYAVSYGICAFRREIGVLVQTWTQAPHLPDALKSRLRTLIQPKRNPLEPNSSSLLPLFDSRTEPITGRASAPKLALRVKDLELSTDREGQGEQVLLVVSKDGTTLSKVSLDFPLIREALACVDDHIGVTDLIDVTAPRLERIRALRLSSRLLDGAEFCLADGDREMQITQQNTKKP